MEKLYVNEIRPDGEASTVGLFYSRDEAENVIAQLERIPDKAACRYEIIEAIGGSPSTNPPQRRDERSKP
jgi:hypothetical protein